MPWEGVSAMDKRVEFVIRARELGSNKSELCREYGISRKTGYQALERYEEEGLAGLAPRSRAPKNFPNALNGEVVCAIIKQRQKHHGWGARKIQSLLERENELESVPSIRSIERVLGRCGLITKRRKRRPKAIPDGEIIQAQEPNDVWTIDFKGDWKMKNGKRCYPLTLRDECTKYILDISGLEGTQSAATKERLKICFSKYGLPKYIRSDNGGPFACIRGVAGLSKLSAWWVKLGIIPNRIPLASPQYNGGHERMHKDMMQELERYPLQNLEQEQRRFNDWKEEFNHVRPHESLSMRCPADVYIKSTRRYDPSEPEFEYPDDVEVRQVCKRGMFSWQGTRKFLSHALAEERIAIQFEDHGMISLWFCELLLGCTDQHLDIPLKERQ